MTKTFNMDIIRYMNLFGKMTRVQPKHCFLYNNAVVFVVPKNLVMVAIGRDNENLKNISRILLKKIRIVPEPKSLADLEYFVSVLVNPAKVEKIEVIEHEGLKEATITTNGRESKAMIIGRNRAREAELKDIAEQYFGIKTIKIV